RTDADANRKMRLGEQGTSDEHHQEQFRFHEMFLLPPPLRARGLPYSRYLKDLDATQICAGSGPPLLVDCGHRVGWPSRREGFTRRRLTMKELARKRQRVQ